MLANWTATFLGDLITLKRGYDLPKSKRREGGIPVYSSSGLTGYHDKAMVQGPGVITGRYGTIGQSFYEEGSYFPLNTTLFVQDFKGNHEKYIYYLLKTLNFKSLSDKSAVPGINRNHVHRIEILKPPLKEQKRIASILSCLDNKITQNITINDNLEQQAQAIFKNWFVDFEPFQDGKFVESELGLIPEGWRVLSFSRFLAPRSEKSNDTTIPEYSVTNTGIYPREAKFKKKLSAISSKNKLVYKDDLVFGMSREILNWGLMEEDLGGVSLAYHVFSINSDIINPQYVGEFMRAQPWYFKDLIRPAAREGQGIDKKALELKSIYMPPIEEYRKYSDIKKAMLDEIRQCKEQSNMLAALRDTLLPKLMSGEIDVSNIAI